MREVRYITVVRDLRYISPLFIPFNIRNNIILENCTNEKDISEFKPNEQITILQSYMKEKDIFNGVNDRIGKTKYSRARANFNIKRI